MYWHKAVVSRRYRGANRPIEVVCYIYGENIMHVLNTFKRMPLVKHIGKKSFPSVARLSDTESSELEDRIKREGRIDLKRAQETWYYPDVRHSRNP